ncbi:MAG: Superkiller protein 3 [Peltula sp. TS41687]|nr:MAG: Superkiller protein 3 [Peltula sp. TS41687]
MSNVKAALKAAKSAIDGQRYQEAVTQAEKVLSLDPQSYHANVFLGLAFDKLERYDESAEAYIRATKSKTAEPLAWQGLVSLYEKQGQKKLDPYSEAALRLAEIYMEANEQQKCLNIIDKLQAHVRDHGSRAQQKNALSIILPSSSVYQFLERHLPSPSDTYKQLAQFTEVEEKERINREIGERRTRLGARIEQVTNEVRREVLSKSPLEDIYQNIINWTRDDDERREYEEKLLRHAYDTLLSLHTEAKADQRRKVEGLAMGMVIIQHPYKLAWEIVHEWKDGESLASWDLRVLREYINFFPDDGLAKVLKGYLNSPLSPFSGVSDEINTGIDTANTTDSVAVNGIDNNGDMNVEDRLVLMTDGIAGSPRSIISHRLMAEYYQHLEEYEAAVEFNRKALELIKAVAQKAGLTFQSSRDSINIVLATALIYYQAPKNFSEARTLFDDILRRKPTSTPASIGTAHILREQEDYEGALGFLERALAQTPENVTVKSEAAWCRALLGNYGEASRELEECLELLGNADTASRNIRAETLYRIGVCVWSLDSSPPARKSRSGAYSRFLGALQANVNFAPAYTSLGIYYADYARDKKRAHKCFMKAIELSASEVVAAERLARGFANERDWDLVELVAQRVVDSGKTRSAPGSKRKAVSWPLTALGVVQLNRQDYVKSIISFQSALRTSPEEYHSWIGLGESYHNSGRYIAATKAFQQAEKILNERCNAGLEEGWLAKYLLANVKRELGEYEEAIRRYEEVLETRPEEFAVLTALVQTLVEYAWQCLNTGFRGRAIQCARKVIDLSAKTIEKHPDVFNIWKAVADACAVFSSGHGSPDEFPWSQMKSLLRLKSDLTEYEVMAKVDGVGSDIVNNSKEDNARISPLRQSLYGTILALKRALIVSASDAHAESSGWYNLGWGEYRAHIRLQSDVNSESGKWSSGHLKAALQCFKRAIETEAGNSDFWNALGVVTSGVSPKISQHSFVRSLHLNDKNVRVWTNYGLLCLLQNDYQLANAMFGRAQAIDPDYAPAWLGQGLLALSLGETTEAQLLFTHAFEISDSFLPTLWRQYPVTTFDQFSLGHIPSEITNLIQPLFALYQLAFRTLPDPAIQHLSGLYHERVGDYAAAIDLFTVACESAEQEYEVSESASSLARFAEGKADLARVQLASDDFAAAIESAETALQLSDFDSGDEPSISDPAARRRCRLSAHLTAGLASFQDHDMDKALEMFRSALEESESNVDVVCLLAQVLWAKGGDKEREVATEQLLDCVEKNPNHLSSTVLLGVIAALENDQETLHAVAGDLRAVRTSDELSIEQRQTVERLLNAIATLALEDGEDEVKRTAEAKRSIMLSPYHPHGWSQLATVCEDSYPARMALKAAQGAVSLGGGALGLQDLAKAFAATWTIGDMQRAIMVAPWLTVGWQGLGEVIGG